MKRRNLLIAFVVTAMTLGYTISKPKCNGETNLLNIRVMARAMAECDSHLEGTNCQSWDDGSESCLFGGEVGAYCDE